MLPPNLLQAYRATQYQAAGIQFRIARRSQALDALLRAMGTRKAVLITAHNPRSRRRPATINARHMQRLHAALGQIPTRPASSGAGPWHETQFFAACPAAKAATLARRFRQNAIVVLRPGLAPRLLLLV